MHSSPPIEAPDGRRTPWKGELTAKT